MGTQIFFHFFIFSLFTLMIPNPLHAHDHQTYIIQLHPERVQSSDLRRQWHLSVLQSIIVAEDEVESRLLYSYHSAIEGFAAHLTEEEVEALRSRAGVITVRRDHRLDLQTTYSYKFLGLSSTGNGAWTKSKFGQGTIIGVLDTGIWPESPSFRDHGMPPVPKRWLGECEEGQSFNSSMCNRKLIGARFYSKGHRAAMEAAYPKISGDEYVSPRDAQGHGTHTSSTAAGNSVPAANVFGNGAGEARGMATGAHVAMYKVCWFSGCYSSDILAGIDDAIRDGVDVLSLSLGGFPTPLYDDNIAIGSFRATERGILVICAAGNNGPIPMSVTNEAPWIVTVGASTLDRRFPAIVRLGNGELLYGESMYPGNHFSKKGGKVLELVYGGRLGGEFCLNNSLPRSRVAGKMVVCDRGITGRASKGVVVKESGGAAMVLANTAINLEEGSVDVHVLPATLVGLRESLLLKDYINKTRKPTARILFGGTVYGRSRDPVVALFSSRGPSLNNPSILKPDIIAPGVNIIAAWPQNLGPTGFLEDSRRVNFTVLSGTSMACPHVSGIAALIRSKHRSWSPAAIKSAIMTTADVYDHFEKPITDNTKPAGIFSMGAGHVNPARAIDPGLVYDIKPADYVTHLCTHGYTRAEIFAITHKNVNCLEITGNNRGFSLNYPSISVIFNKKDLRMRERVTRRLTNVGLPNSTYSVEVKAPGGVEVSVDPRKLTFEYLNQSKIFRVRFTSKRRIIRGKMKFSQGHLIWVHEHHLYKVRSPISVTWAG